MALFTKDTFEKKDLSPPGFGTFFGVYLPGILSMFGVIIYLRFGWIIGSLGLFKTVSVVTLACLIVFVTVLSIASAATNMLVKGGGTYYMVSRSLGLEVGSAIGIPLFLAQALAISFCTVGFAESIQVFFPTVPLAYLGATTLVILLGLVSISAAIALKTQLVIFLVILGSLASLFLGEKFTLDGVPDTFNSGLACSFWAGFALFFPAATGVEAGVSMSGDLRSPTKSLPRGTIAVLLTGFVVYLCIPFFMWTHAPRSLLVTDAFIFQHIARFEHLIIAGIWAATLSSILSGLLAAPRTMQALAVDGVLPKFLAKEWGKNKEPRIATFFTFAIAMVGVLFGSIDKIAPVLTMFYLIAYATLNLATGLEELLNNPSWRPTFRIPWMISIGGVGLCLLAMFMIDPGATFMALFFVLAVYLFMKKRNIAKEWEDLWDGFLVFLSRFAIYKLADKQHSPRAWRPNFLVLSSSPVQENYLVNLTSDITQGKGFLTLAKIFSPQNTESEKAENWKKFINSHLKENNIAALVEYCMDESLLSGAKKLLLNYGMGPISPNTLVMGEMKNREQENEYFDVIFAACQAKKNVIIIREKNPPLGAMKRIDLWWDDTYQANSELMLLLSHMLKSNKHYRKTKIFLNSIVTSNWSKSQRMTLFHNSFVERRFSVTPKVYIKERSHSPWGIMTTISETSDVVFIGMLPPNGSMDAFKDYYFEMMRESAKIPNAVFVISNEMIDISEIFKIGT